MTARRRRKYKGPKSDIRVFLHDEVPAIGSGWRGITIRKEGRLWAHLTETSTATNFKLPIAKWREIAKSSLRRFAL